MKYARTMLVVLSMVAIAVSSASAVTITNGATTVFQDDFESNTTVSTSGSPDASGDYDPDAASVGTWSTADTAAQVQVTSYGTPGTPEGDNYLRFDGTGGFSYTQFSSNQTSGTLHIEALVRQVGNASNGVALCVRNSAGQWGPHVQMWAGQTVMGYYDGNYSNSTLAFSADAWHAVEIDWVIGSSTFDLTVDGVTQTGLASRGTAASMDEIRIGGGSMEHYYDAVPEPATMSLLGLGGLLALVRRRRK